jgi:phosphoglycolate phosphatase
MNPQLLIFDLDGTLIDSRQDLCAGINLMRRHYGLAPLALDQVAGFIGAGVRNLVMRSLEGHDIDIDEAVRINNRFYSEHMHDRTVLYPGVAGGLKTLFDQGHALALLSNKGQAACLKILAHFKIAGYFRAVIGGDSPLPLKPDPAAVFEIMRLAGASAAAAWMIGDNHTDLAAARNAGVKCVFVTYGIGRTGDEKPSLTFDDFNSLARYFTGQRDGPLNTRMNAKKELSAQRN